MKPFPCTVCDDKGWRQAYKSDHWELAPCFACNPDGERPQAEARVYDGRLICAGFLRLDNCGMHTYRRPLFGWVLWWEWYWRWEVQPGTKWKGWMAGKWIDSKNNVRSAKFPWRKEKT